MKRITVSQDDYSAWPEESLLAGRGLEDQSVGRWEQTSYHYGWKSERLPNRQAGTIPWRKIVDGETCFLEQPETWGNVVLRAGDEDWRDYRLMVTIIPISMARCGVLFRYQTSRHYYFLAFEEERRVALYRRDNDDLILLTSCPLRYSVGGPCAVTIDAEGDTLRAFIDGKHVLEACDTAFLCGCIGLRSDGPVRYGAVKVDMEEQECAAFNVLSDRKTQLQKERQAAFSPPETVKRIPIRVAADSFYLNDINGDGELETLFLKQHCTGPDRTNIAYIGVADAEGHPLWSRGEPKENLYPLHADVAFNFGDGVKEIIFTQDGMIRIVNGLTGELKCEAPTPASEYEKHVIGDSFLLADLRGVGARRDIIFKDRYENLWAYDANLNLLWHRRLNTGHYPRAADINGDGREEIMAGYSMLTADGETMWTVPDADPLRNVWNEPPYSEHMDSVWIGRFDDEEKGPVQVAMAASDLGFLLFDANTGELLHRERCGHAQSLAIGKFRKGLPGAQFVVCNHWGNSGILSICDGNGKLLARREAPPFGMVIPINWKGDGEAYFFTAHSGRIFDGNLNHLWTFPPPGGKKMQLVKPFIDDFLNLGVDQIAYVNGNCVEIAKPTSHGTLFMKHNTENFNNYGAFYLR